MSFFGGRDPFDDPFFHGGRGGAPGGTHERSSEGERRGDRQAQGRDLTLFGRGGGLMGGMFGGGADPFAAMEQQMHRHMGAMREHHQRMQQHHRAIQQQQSQDLFGGQGHSFMNPGEGGHHVSYSSSSYSSMSSGDQGAPVTYSRTVQHRSDGVRSETQEIIHDGRKGESHTRTQRKLRDGRASTIEKHRLADGSEKEIETRENIQSDEDNARFHAEWRDRASAAATIGDGGRGYRQGHRQVRNQNLRLGGAGDQSYVGASEDI